MLQSYKFIGYKRATKRCFVLFLCLFLYQTLSFAQNGIQITIQKKNITIIDALKEVEIAIDAALPRSLILDFTGVTFMASSGIALILRSQQRMQLMEGSVVLRNVPEQARRVLDAAGIGRLVSIQ